MITIHDRMIKELPTNNGYGTLVPDSCTISREINGAFTLSLSHPYDEGEKWKKIEIGRVLFVPDPSGGQQLFRIERKDNKTVEGKILVTATHIFWDLSKNSIINYAGTAKNGQEIVQGLLSNTQFPHPFTITSDITEVQNINIVRRNPINALIGSDAGSFVSLFGNVELQVNNFTAAMKYSIGTDTGRTIRYGKDLEKLEFVEDESDAVTRISVMGRNSDDSIITATTGGGFIDSPRIGLYESPRIAYIDATDVKVGAEIDGVVKYPTLAAARTELARRANEAFSVGRVDYPVKSLDVSFRDITASEEYKEYLQLQKVQIGDTVTIKDEFTGTNEKLKIIAYDYDCLNQEYISVRLGSNQKSLVRSVNETKLDLSSLQKDTSRYIKQGSRYNDVYISQREGFVAECAELNTRAVLNGEKMGFYNNTTNAFMGGMANMDGIIAFLAGVLSDDVDSDFYAKIGDTVGVGGSPSKGILGFNRKYSTKIPIFEITTEIKKNSSTGNVEERIVSFNTDGFGQLIFAEYADGTKEATIKVGVNNIISKLKLSNKGFAEMSRRVSDGTMCLGVDNDGPYYIKKDGVKKYI